MTYRTHATPTPCKSAIDTLRTGLKLAVFTVCAVLWSCAPSMAAEPPDAPSAVASMAPIEPITPVTPVQASKTLDATPIDKTFIGLALVSSGSTFADSYTTLFARQNWLAGKKGVCNMEVESAYLYGTHPTVGRAYTVASAKSAASIFAAYYMRKHHSKFWSLPLIGNSVISLQGVTQNMMACN
jgi:hypothetical protein